MRRFFIALVLIASPSLASAQEVFVGAYAHDVQTPITRSGQENGVDLHLGWRGAPIGALRAIGSPSPHAFVSLNTAGDTSFAGAGISWKIGNRFYARPGIGLAVHNGPSEREATPDRIDFGSRVVFVPELAAGVAVTDRVSVEASWVHLSHAKLFGPQNPGSDNFGVRLNYRF